MIVAVSLRLGADGVGWGCSSMKLRRAPIQMRMETAVGARRIWLGPRFAWRKRRSRPKRFREHLLPPFPGHPL